MDEVTYRWLDGATAPDDDWSRIELILAARGWMSLNRQTSRILIAERDGTLYGFHVFQLVPYAGPLWVAPSARGSGIAERLADDMLDFLATAQARGFIVTTESAHAEKLCEAHGMERMETPLYVMPLAAPGGMEVE